MGQCQECNKHLNPTEECVCEQCKTKILAKIEEDWEEARLAEG